MRVALSILCILFFCCQGSAQCINTFPYTEDFETSDGGWTSGGTGNDWAWGPPTKTVITQAAGGSNCWVTGGLTGSFYTLGARSYVQSPCFDFTTLKRPYISFNIFWESERTYDGATLQYSLDGGTTWTNLGSMSDSPNCFDQNWFNSPNIVNLSGLTTTNEGWAGNIQPTQGSCQGGDGSSTWRLAKHCMLFLQGQPNVTFRFAFGAGTNCNNFDGFAFDDVTIEEGPANTADFTYTCNGSTINFTGLVALCPYGVTWDFGDGTTGSGINPSHTYTVPGAYNVKFTAPGPCDTPVSIIKVVQGIDLSITTDPVPCNGGFLGTAVVTPLSTNGPFTYAWNTTPTQTTDTATGLAAGTYVVTVTSANQCVSTATAVITEPELLQPIFIIIPDTCATPGVGAIVTSITGGNPPYSILWSNGETTPGIYNLTAGQYNHSITDSKGCPAVGDVLVDVVSGIDIQFTIKNESCYKTNDGNIVAVAEGTPPLTYQWQNGNAGSSVSNLGPGSYQLTVTDAQNCTASATAVVEKEVCPTYVYFPNAFSPNKDGINETFKPLYSPNINKYIMRIYNRWGEKVFETDDITEGWDGIYQGTLQPLSVYIWIAEYSFIDGTSDTKSGNLTLMR